MSWDRLTDDATVAKTVASLTAHNIDASVVATAKEATQRVLSLVPKGAQVMTMSSVTLETLGLDKAFAESGDYDSVNKQLSAMDRKTQGRQMQQLGAAPEWAIGSVHAVTLDGHALIASNTGSQLPAYAYGAAHVVWVVGIQKIVSTVEKGMKRIYEYVLPLEDAHMKQLYNMGSAVNKLLIFNAEKIQGRVTVVFVREKLGF